MEWATWFGCAGGAGRAGTERFELVVRYLLRVSKMPLQLFRWRPYCQAGGSRRLGLGMSTPHPPSLACFVLLGQLFAE
eukprot:10310042-Alexandrium_andersonii.AAC.1